MVRQKALMLLVVGVVFLQMLSHNWYLAARNRWQAGFQEEHELRYWWVILAGYLLISFCVMYGMLLVVAFDKLRRRSLHAGADLLIAYVLLGMSWLLSDPSVRPLLQEVDLGQLHLLFLLLAIAWVFVFAARLRLYVLATDTLLT